MPQDLVVNDRLRVTYASHMMQQNGLNVCHYKVVEKGSGPISDLDIAIALEAIAKPLYRDTQSLYSSFYGVRVQKLTGGPWVPQIKNSTANFGLVDSEPLPPQIAGLIALKTDRASRSGRGRKFIPFPYEDAWNEEGKWNDAYITKLQTLAAELFGRVTMVIGGTTVKIDAEITSPGGSSGNPVTVALVRPFPATMRTRSLLGGAEALPW